MTLDQQIQLLGVIGAWIAGFGSLFASIVALWLARRSERVKLKAHVGLRVCVGGGASYELLAFRVTNLGERDVTIVAIGWRIGKGKNRKLAIQPLTPSSQDVLPRRLKYGEEALFSVDFVQSPDWISDFAKGFISNKQIQTLRAEIHTSVGYVHIVEPEKPLLKRLHEAHTSSASK